MHNIVGFDTNRNMRAVLIRFVLLIGVLRFLTMFSTAFNTTNVDD